MIQQHHATQAGRFSKCPSCGRQPQHIEHFGRTRLETMNFSIPAHRHSLECPCGRHTARCATLAEAEVEWGMLQSQIQLVLPDGVTHIHRARKPRKAARS